MDVSEEDVSLNTLFSVSTSFRPITLQGDLLALSDDVSQTAIWNWRKGTYATLRHLQLDGHSLWQVVYFFPLILLKIPHYRYRMTPAPRSYLRIKVSLLFEHVPFTSFLNQISFIVETNLSILSHLPSTVLVGLIVSQSPPDINQEKLLPIKRFQSSYEPRVIIIGHQIITVLSSMFSIQTPILLPPCRPIRNKVPFPPLPRTFFPLF